MIRLRKYPSKVFGLGRLQRSNSESFQIAYKLQNPPAGNQVWSATVKVCRQWGRHWEETEGKNCFFLPFVQLLIPVVRQKCDDYIRDVIVTEIAGAQN